MIGYIAGVQFSQSLGLRARMRKRSSLVSVKSKTLRQFDIKTFTGRYDVVEDRLRLDSVDSSNNKESIFLTRRLTDKI